MKVTPPKVFLWIFALVFAVIAIYLVESEQFDFVRAIEEENRFLIHAEEKVPRENVTSYIVADGKLFVHYENNELVNVYSDAGEYLYGIQISDGTNGTAGILYQDGLLYFKGKNSGIYVFSDNELVRLEELSVHNDGYDVLDALFPGEESHSDGGYVYYYIKEENKFVRTDDQKTEDVLLLPKNNSCVGVLACSAMALFMLGYKWDDAVERIKKCAGQ